MAKRVIKDYRKYASYLATLGDPIWNDLGQVTGFVGGPYFYDDPADSFELAVTRTISGFKDARGPLSTINRKIPDYLDTDFERRRGESPEIREPQTRAEMSRESAILDYFEKNPEARRIITQGGDSPSFVETFKGVLGDLGKIIFPITQAFGNFNPGIELFSGGVNYGVDFGTPEGTPVGLPEGNWKIIDVYNDAARGFLGNSENSGYGNSVLAENVKTGEKIRLSHLQYTPYRAGETYNGGTVALTGATGNITGPHVDVEYYDSSGRIKDITATKYASQIFLGKKTKTEMDKMQEVAQPEGIEKSKSALEKKFGSLVNPAFAESPSERIKGIKGITSRDSRSPDTFKRILQAPGLQSPSRNTIDIIAAVRAKKERDAIAARARQQIMSRPPRPTAGPPSPNFSTSSGPSFAPPPPPTAQAARSMVQSALPTRQFITVPPPPPPTAQAARRTLASVLPLGKFIFK